MLSTRRASFAIGIPALISLCTHTASAQLLAPAQEIHGLTGGAIVRFTDRAPRRTTEVVQRLFGSQAIVAIDFSPRDGQLYALDNAGGIYRMALDVGQQIPVSRIEGALIGSFHGMDFDPVDGRLRIVTDVGTHLLHDLGTHRTQVLPLLADAATPGQAARGVVGLAHSNNVSVASTASTAFVIDHERDRLARLDGVSGVVTSIAPLAPARRFARPITTAATVGFDIVSRVDASGGTTANIAYASLQPEDFRSPVVVYRMDLATAQLTSLGSIDPTPAGDLIDIAIRPDTRPLAAVAAAAVVTGPVVGLSPRNLDFAEQPVAAPAAVRVITLRNDGDADLMIRAAAGQAGPFGTSYQCPDFLPPTESCLITVRFAPTVEGPASSQIRLLTNAASSPDDISLTGRGVTPLLSLSADSLDFGSRLIGLPTLPETLELRNDGNGSLRLDAFAITGDYLLRGQCPAALAPGEACRLRISFRAGAAGVRNGDLSITTNLSASPRRVALTGSGRRLLDGR